MIKVVTNTFKHKDLKLVEPPFKSSLTDLIMELNFLRKKDLSGSTIPQVFFQLKHIFHTLESIGSARIEGNNTTITEYIEIKLENRKSRSPNIIEIQNIEKAVVFVEDNIKKHPFNRAFVSEIHKIIIEDLLPPPKGEGDLTPGEYRKTEVNIAHSKHKPPEFLNVIAYMDELLDFINREDGSKYDLLKTAIAHHRFTWIHPFRNGNGRTVRLITYAMLIKQGFNVDIGRIINPTAIFCNDRDEYYHYLSEADKGTDEGILSWCEYVLKGLKIEVEKIDKLLDYEYLKKNILIPAIIYSLDRKLINETESRILKRVVEKKIIQAGDLKDIFQGKINSEVSRQIKKLKDKKMLMPEQQGVRKYIIRFDNNYLLRGIMNSLDKKGFLPRSLI